MATISHCRQMPDVQEKLRQHIEATAERDRWAYKAKELLDSGNKGGARKALGKAYEWDEKLKQLEAGAAHQIAKRGPYI
jgi:thioredoxin-like negative regulator of GroEL